MNLAFPYRFDGRNRTAVVDDAGHIRDLIEQVLFTMPSERVNRPDFGSGIRQLVFAPNSVELAATTSFLVQGALQQWLSDWILVEDVKAEAEDASLIVTITYTIRRSQERRTDVFKQAGGAP
ncbi:MAG: GPW/gp25 family protein [Dongiaceae bacterium]